MDLAPGACRRTPPLAFCDSSLRANVVTTGGNGGYGVRPDRCQRARRASKEVSFMGLSDLRHVAVSLSSRHKEVRHATTALDQSEPPGGTVTPRATNSDGM